MKLLIIARPFVFYGGVERATAGLVRALLEHGYEVDLLSLPGQAPLAGVRLRTLPLPPLPALGRVLALAVGARLVAGQGRWDVVQSHERTLRQDVYRAGEGCHRAYLEAVLHPRGRGLYHRVVLALERRVFARTPRIVAIAGTGKAEIERLYGLGPGRVSVVYNGVDLERFHPRNREIAGAAARGEVAIPRDAWTLLFVGSGFERKGLRAALEAFAALDDRGSRLIVVGRGDLRPYRGRARELGVEGRVAWLGPRTDVERWYAAADIVVLPALYEPFGNVHLEALASGLPVIASARAGGAEVVRDGESGGVVDPRDPGAIRAALQRLRVLSPHRVAEAARRAAEPYTYAAQVAGFARIYHECARAKGDFP